MAPAEVARTPGPSPVVINEVTPEQDLVADEEPRVVVRETGDARMVVHEAGQARVVVHETSDARVVANAAAMAGRGIGWYERSEAESRGRDCEECRTCQHGEFPSGWDVTVDADNRSSYSGRRSERRDGFWKAQCGAVWSLGNTEKKERASNHEARLIGRVVRSEAAARALSV